MDFLSVRCLEFIVVPDCIANEACLSASGRIWLHPNGATISILGFVMKAAVVPSVNGKWEVKEVPTPKAGPNQVVIKIHASGLCYTDIHITQGMIPTQFPRVLGHEPVGEIVEVGVGVISRKIGDRVGVPWVQAGCGRCEWCLRGKGELYQNTVSTGIQTWGSHAEYMLAEAAATMLIPNSLGYQQAAPIFCAGYTVWSGLRLADPKPHERIAVVGIGGLGHLALQYAKTAGFETIAVTKSKDKETLIRQLGADEIVENGEKLLTAGGADVLLATSNSWTATADAMKGMRPDGRVDPDGSLQRPAAIPSRSYVQARAAYGVVAEWPRVSL
jgi:alcohol dehydrogenase